MDFTLQTDIIIELCQPDIENPVRKIYEEYFEGVVGQICANGGNTDDGADIFQEAVLVLIEKIKTGKFRGESSIKTFLSAIARNLWLHELRTRGRRNKREILYANNEDKTDQAFERLMDIEMEDKLQQVMEQVGKTCKKILTGFYYEQKSMKELLTEFDYENEQVLRNQKSKCMKKLKELIETNVNLLRTLKSYFE